MILIHRWQLAALQGLRSDVNKLLDQGLSTKSRKQAREEFRSLGQCLALFQLDKWQFNRPKNVVPLSGTVKVSAQVGPASLTVHSGGDEEEQRIHRLVEERCEAKKRKEFKRADEIRTELASQGITIEDKPDGTSRWKR